MQRVKKTRMDADSHRCDEKLTEAQSTQRLL